MLTLTATELGFYLFALLLLFITPGPVWVALLARTLKGGFSAAWPLALGVAVGDVCWPLLALLSLGQLVSIHTEILFWLRYLAVVTFIVIGLTLCLARVTPLHTQSQLTKEGILAGFLAGLLVIIGNPKAVLFYMGILPGFFDISRLSPVDIGVIAASSALLPFLGNLGLGLLVGRASRLVNSERRRKQLNQISGIILILVGGLILVTV